MVETQFIKKFQKILRTLIRNKGNIYLFMIIKLDKVSEKWSIILSAPWVNFEEKSKHFKYLTNLLRKNLNAEESAMISRLGFYKEESPLVQLITKMIRLRNGAMRLKNTQFNGLTINDAYIFHSQLSPKSKIPAQQKTKNRARKK